jgi:hypothetical protein
MAHRTLLRAVLEQRGWLSWAVFEEHFTSAARRVSDKKGFTQMSISQSTFKRWLSGEHDPRSLAGVVLEEMLGVETELLFRPAPSRDVELPRPLHLSSRVAALALDARWGNSTLCPTSPAAGVDGTWQLDGLGLFDGTSVAVQTYEAVELPDDVVAIGPEDYPHLRAFVRPLRRALVLGSLGANHGTGLYALDAVYARRHLSIEQPVEMLPIPAAYRLDDLTFGILWALINIDDGLSADDHLLRAEVPGLQEYLSRPLSALARSAVPGLSSIGSAYLGSRLCAEHAIRQLHEHGETTGPGDSSESLVLWNRDSRGEEAAGWLFFRHQHRFVAEAVRHGQAPLGSAFCVPETAVKDSPPYERVLLFLAIAWMEMRGLTAWVCREQEYAGIDGHVLVPGQRAVVTNWLRTPDVWHVDTTDRKSRLRAYGQAVDHARTHSVTEGATTTARLRALADYLELDWPWLTRRCRELGAYGTVDMLRPHSRQITLDELDLVLDFVGRIGPA